ncbi:hypothetical protein HOK51_04115 [Candidatus Woesearchaeota archaeon]|nr:hypothetical protein [Candidatus Woesearchaeota archaeon]MBT6519007.1 hypothetical protein [Candidatus Woesearchaeota archaeon]MBT7368794.1 hypothetical protein [Candidatus Woesearchaeota archaeon]
MKLAHKTIGIGILAATLALGTGCGEAVPPTQEEQRQTENLQVGLKLGDPIKLEGVITEVTPGAFNYLIIADKAGGCNYDIMWVTIRDLDKSRTLLYPTSGAVRKGNATVTYRPIIDSELNQLEFLKNNAIPSEVVGYDTNRFKNRATQNPTTGKIIPVEGIIDLDGIDYNL